MANRFLSNIRINDAYTFPASDGTNGQVISTDGSGNLSFVSVESQTGSTVIYQDNFSGDGSTVDFTLSNSVSDEVITQVYIDGVYQNKDTYSVSNTTLTFSTAPSLNSDVEVITFNTATTADDLQAGVVIIPVKNTHTASIAKGEPVYITGNVGSSSRLEIAPADASNSAKMPAAGLLLQTLAVNEEGYAVTGGYLRNITTDTIDGTSTSSNDTVYVKSGGGLTMTKPTGSNLIQNIAKVARSASGNAGSLIVSSILRTNDVPNLTTGKIWVGSTNTVESTVIHLDESNNRLGINNTSPAYSLDVTGTANITGNITTSGTVDGVDIAAFKTDYDSHTHTESEITDFGNYLTNVTHDTVNTKLVVTKRDGTTTDLSLSQYIDDTNLARLTSGTLNSTTGIATFTRDDATTFTVDFSALFDDTDTNDYVSSASFNTSDGVLTLTRTDAGTVTVDLDGRYLQSYTETDTLATVTGRGASTSQTLDLNGQVNLNSTVRLDPNGTNFEIDTDSQERVIFSFNVNGTRNWSLRHDSDLNFYRDSGSGNVQVNGNRVLTTADNVSNWDTAYGWGNHADAGYLTSYTETDTLATVTSRGNTTSGDINVHGNILLTGPVTTTNQGRTIDFTGFDKEGTTDFTDRAYIRHTVNTGGYAGSVLEISSQNDANDGIVFTTNASSPLKHNGNDIITSATIGAQSVNYASTAGDASSVQGRTAGSSTNNLAYLDSYRNLVINNPEGYTGEVRLGAAWDYGGVYASSTLTMASSSDINFVINDAVYANLTTDYFSHNSSLRAPVFYDSNDTNWWIDPAAGSSAKFRAFVQIGDSSSYNTNSGGWGARLNVTDDIHAKIDVAQDANGMHSHWYAHTGQSSIKFGTTSSHGVEFISNNSGRGQITSGGTLEWWNNVTAPIFYDYNDTNYYLDAAGNSRIKYIQDDRYNEYVTLRHSGSDFADGTLVATDIPSSATNGASFVIEVTGKSYSSTPPFSFMAQGYLYNNGIINASGVNNGDPRISYIKVMNYNGYLHFWWPRISYWNSFEVRVRDAGGGATNRATGISNSAEPSGATKVTQINLTLSALYGYNTNVGDLYATAFYDGNNTGYYINPASTSNIGNLHADGYIHLSRSNTTGNGIILADDGDIVDLNDAYCSMRFSYGVRIFSANRGGSAVHTLHSDGNAYFNTSARSPIFYDNNNTAYYVNPDSTSTIRKTNIVASGSAWDAGLNLYSNNGSDRWNLLTDEGAANMLRVAYNNSEKFRIQTNGEVYTIGTGLAGSDYRAPIFYDSNDTSNYIDPSGTSQVGGMRIYPTIATGRSSGSYSEAYANLILEATSATPSGYANIEFKSNYNHPSDGAAITYYTGIDGGEASQLRIRLNNDYNDGIALWGGYIDFDCRTVDGSGQGRRDPIFKWMDYGNQKMALTSSGNLTVESGIYVPFLDIDKTSTYGTGIDLTFSGSSSTGMLIRNNTGTTTSAINFFYSSAPQGARGSITVSSTSTAYNTSSDYRLKENVVPMEGSLDRVDQLKPSRFNFIGEEEVVDGFLAHEVQEVVPEAITGTKDAVDEDGNPIYQGIDQGKLVPLLVGAIQELRAEVEALKQQLNGTN